MSEEINPKDIFLEALEDIETAEDEVGGKVQMIAVTWFVDGETESILWSNKYGETPWIFAAMLEEEANRIRERASEVRRERGDEDE